MLRQSEGEVAAAISEIRFYAGQARAIRGNAQEIAPGVFSTIYREPAGVAAIIVPWNGPVLLLIRSLAPALAAGCTAIVKPAPQTSLVTVEVLKHLAAVAALPKGTVQLVMETGSAVAEHLVAASDVDVVSFTGSTAVGQKIMAAAAPSLKKLSLELGGKSCCLVFDDADIGAVAPLLAAAATIISGQQCTAARRVLVHRSRLAEMSERAEAGARRDPRRPGPRSAKRHGSADRHARARQRRKRDAGRVRPVRRGRAARTPPRRPARRRRVPDAPAQSSIPTRRPSSARRRFSGRSSSSSRSRRSGEAIAKANNTVFGLAASVWTRDGARALRVARALRDGTVWINDHNKLFAEAEMGGYRRSGIGRLHGASCPLTGTVRLAIPLRTIVEITSVRG